MWKRLRHSTSGDTRGFIVRSCGKDCGILLPVRRGDSSFVLKERLRHSTSGDMRVSPFVLMERLRHSTSGDKGIFIIPSYGKDCGILLPVTQGYSPFLLMERLRHPTSGDTRVFMNSFLRRDCEPHFLLFAHRHSSSGDTRVFIIHSYGGKTASRLPTLSVSSPVLPVTRTDG